MLIDAANGDTADTLSDIREFRLGNHADGSAFWVCNVDAANVIHIEWSGSHAGVGAVNLTAKGDEIVIPAGDVTSVTVSASAYPSTFGWAYLDPGMRIASGQKR